jgi:ribosomal protein S10
MTNSIAKMEKLYTVNTSHFVNKDSREQYEQFVYTRLIDVSRDWYQNYGKPTKYKYTSRSDG